MNTKSHSLLGGLITAALMAAVPALYAQTAPGDFKGEPDKTLASAHESFVKGDMTKAGQQIKKAGAYVTKQSDKVADDTKDGMKQAGAELDKLGDGVKAGTVKSGDELKKTFAKVDHQTAVCWHKTAQESKAAGKDSTAALKQAGAGLEGAAKWSGHQLSEGTKASMDGLKKAGKATGAGAKAGAEQMDKWFKGIGDGIDDLGHKL
jgi:hypothetical protein